MLVNGVPGVLILKTLYDAPSVRLVALPYTRIYHDDVIQWTYFPRYWPFLRGIHYSPVNSPQKGQWRWCLMFSLICACINGWVNNREAGDLRRHHAHHDVIVMYREFAHAILKSFQPATSMHRQACMYPFVLWRSPAQWRMRFFVIVFFLLISKEWLPMKILHKSSLLH